MTSPATRAAGIQPGASVRLKPGLRDKPAISGRAATVVELVNDRIRVSVGGNHWVVERSEVQS